MTTMTISQPYNFTGNIFSDWKMTAKNSNALTFEFAGQTLTMTGVFGTTTDGKLFGSVMDMKLVMDGKEMWTATKLSLDASLLPGMKVFQELYPYLFGGEDYIVGSAGNDGIVSYAGNDHIVAGAGNDYIIPGAGNDVVDGGAGFDTVAMTGPASSYTFTRNGAGSFTITAKDGSSVDTITNVERVEFGDKVLAADIDANAISGQVLRLYRASFDRLPDDAGQRYWQMQAENGSGLAQIADAFVKSTEYQKLYNGASNGELVNQFYQHILHRTPDAAGVEFWTKVLDEHRASQAQVLVAISESSENVAASVTLIGQGVLLEQQLITF